MENEILKESLEPIVDNNSQILVLGSLPSDESIRAAEYYGNARNQFWDIVSLIFENKKAEFKNYDEKIQFLHAHHIALWDTYSSATRKGSLDENIKNGQFNDLKGFMNKYSNIKTILLNGGKSETAFKKYLKSANMSCNYKYVLSSSPANTKYTFLEKVECWKKAMFE